MSETADNQIGTSGPRAWSRDAITLRPATDADYDFMRQLYGSVRAEEMKQFPLTDEQKVVFLDQQFSAQSKHYASHYPTADFHIIELDGERIGRLYVDRWPREIRIVDIAIVDDYRNSGIGTTLLREVMERGRTEGLPVTIHVEAYNPALRLYERLGFKHVDTNGVYHLMKWDPA